MTEDMSYARCTMSPVTLLIPLLISTRSSNGVNVQVLVPSDKTSNDNFYGDGVIAIQVLTQKRGLFEKITVLPNKSRRAVFQRKLFTDFLGKAPQLSARALPKNPAQKVSAQKVGSLPKKSAIR